MKVLPITNIETALRIYYAYPEIGNNTVFVVFPAWWYTMPMPMFSFFDEYDFSGKTIIPAVTHEGSRLAGSPATIKGLEPDAEVKTNGFDVRFGNAPNAKSDVENWIDIILN